MAVVYNFDEILFDPSIFTAGDAQGGPEYDNTMIRNPPTGVYKVNITRFDFQQVWVFDLNLLSPTFINYLSKIWAGGFGSAYGLRVRIVTDFTAIDEVLGVSDGVDSTWSLTKGYQRPGVSRKYTRRIIKPVVNTLLGGSGVTLYEPDGVTTRAIPSASGTALGATAFKLMFNGVTQASGYTIDNTNGNIVLAGKTFTVDNTTEIFTINSHGYVLNDGISFANVGGALPTPLVAGTIYYARDITTNTFRVATTPGGAALNITSNGTGTNRVPAPPVGVVLTWTGEFDTPMRFLQNSIPLRADVASEAKGVQMVEIMPAELGITS